MGLTNKREDQLKRMPLIESKFNKSKDGKYIIHKTTITTIRPLAYFEKVVAEQGTVDDVEVETVLGEDLASA